MKVLIDTNIVLDVLGNREPFVQHSAEILILAAQQKLSASITANTNTNIYYLTKKYISNREDIKRTILGLIEVLDVIDVTRSDCIKAFELSMTDYEDALLAQCARRTKAAYIITRDTKDFSTSPVEAITPKDFLNRFFPE
jgi:predicted nucleic acid-binding protein